MTADPYGLDRLQDIVAPAGVPWWPPATGFWLVSALILLWLVAAVSVYVLRYRRDAYRREALARLKAIAPRLRADDHRAETLAEVAELLKRTALAGYPREEVAGLSGSEWLAFLDRTGGGTDFITGPASVIAVVPYRSGIAEELSADEVAAVVGCVRRWIRRHRTAGGA